MHIAHLMVGKVISRSTLQIYDSFMLPYYDYRIFIFNFKFFVSNILFSKFIGQSITKFDAI